MSAHANGIVDNGTLHETHDNHSTILIGCFLRGCVVNLTDSCSGQ